jgi:tRNA(fMet)-specific endonuclease VapC
VQSVLIDSSILIDHLRGRTEAQQFLSSVLASGQLVTSEVVAAELITGARNLSDQRQIDLFLSRFQIHSVESVDSTLSLRLLRDHRLSSNIGWLDCLIAACALRLQIPVATLNERHFRVVPGLAVVRPY